MFRQLREDIAIVKEKDPAARSSLEILLTYSGLKAVRSYRRAHWFYQHKWFTIARIISQRARHKTGIEMEALTAASVACLTIYDMCKAVDRGMEIMDVRLLLKDGGKTGLWTREEQGE